MRFNSKSTGLHEKPKSSHLGYAFTSVLSHWSPLLSHLGSKHWRQSFNVYSEKTPNYGSGGLGPGQPSRNELEL